MNVGFVQNDPVFGAVEGNLEQVAEQIAGLRADLLVLPELFTTGYQFTSAKEAFELAQPIPDGPATQTLLAWARETGGTIVAGLAEREGDRVYNSSAIVSPRGFLGRYRKIHLFDTEKDCFHPGTDPPPVFDLGGAKVGVMICFDWRFPETARTLALKGADLLAHPANLVLPHCPDAMITRCLENRVFAITADRVGREERIPGQPLQFMGQSQVVDPEGHVLHRASAEAPETRTVAIDLEKARQKWLTPRNHLFQDRREDLYRIV